jgi:hypothetical protein
MFMSENEKAVRTLFEQWWNDKCANMPILDYGYETMAQDIAFHAFKAALQSQSNTDGWVTDEQIDRILSTVQPGGSQARDWFLPHEHPKGLENVRNVVRSMLSAAPKAPQQVSNTPQDEMWMQVINEQTVLCHTSGWADSCESIEDVRSMLNEIIEFHVSAATNPETNGGYVLVKSTPPQQVSNTPQDGLPKQRDLLRVYVEHGFICVRTSDAKLIANHRIDALQPYQFFEIPGTATPPQQQEQSGEAVKHCNKCGLGKREWAACDAPDCGELVASNSHAKPAAYYAGDLNGQLKDFRVALVDPELEIPLNTPFFLSPQFDASTATPTATASQESAPGQEAVVEAVARVFRDPELGVRVEWLIEGGAGACLDQVLLASPTKLTNDEGYGTVYLAPPTSTAIAATVIKQAVDICDEHICSTWSQLRAAIAALTPASAEAELEALMKQCVEYAFEAAGKGWVHGAPEAIVRRVLDENGE